MLYLSPAFSLFFLYIRTRYHSRFYFFLLFLTMNNHPLIFIFISLCCLILVSQSSPLIEKRALNSCYKKALFTYYWVPKEGEQDINNNGKIITLTGERIKNLKNASRKTLAKVAKKTKSKIRMEGTGLLESGHLINLGTHLNEFMRLNRKKTPYGLGSKNNGLVPYVSVAANDIPFGTTLYVKALDGVKLPTGAKHNGCVRVDDVSWSFNGCHIDFFVLQYSAYRQFKLPNTVAVVQKSCKVKNYIDSSIQSWAGL